MLLDDWDRGRLGQREVKAAHTRCAQSTRKTDRPTVDARRRRCQQFLVAHVREGARVIEAICALDGLRSTAPPVYARLMGGPDIRTPETLKEIVERHPGRGAQRRPRRGRPGPGRTRGLAARPLGDLPRPGPGRACALRARGMSAWRFADVLPGMSACPFADETGASRHAPIAPRQGGMVDARPLGQDSQRKPTPSMTTTPQRMTAAASAAPRPRRGWRERIEPGVYRLHRIACPATREERPGGRCTCAYQVLVPGVRPGLTRTVSVRGSLTQACAERRRLQAAGRPLVAAAAPDPPVSLTINALAEQWMHARTGVLAPNSLAEVEVDLRLRIAPVLGDLLIDHITRQQVEQLVAGLLACGASVRMVRGVVSTVRRLLQAALEWGLIASNPARRVRLPAPQTHARQAHERVLSMDELSRLVGTCRGSLRTETMIRAMAEAGLRRGEVIGLRWEDVDLVGLRLHVRRSVSDVKGIRQERTTKGKRSRRVAISERFAARLAAWRVRSGGERATGYVWPGRDGKAMNAHSPNQSLTRVLRRAGLVDADGVPLVTPHGLRHTPASLMLAAGVPLIVVSHQLGHANANVTAQVYAHLLCDAQLDEAAAAFAGLGLPSDHVAHDAAAGIAADIRTDTRETRHMCAVRMDD